MSLPDISFVDSNPVAIESTMVTVAESYLSSILPEGQSASLARSDPRRLILLAFTALLIQLRVEIDHTAKMNLLAYATGDYLDHLGHLLNVPRLEAAAAKTKLKFTLSSPATSAVLIPAGTRATPDGKIYFVTDELAEVARGESSVDVPATCTVAGLEGNGWAVGQISRLVDPLPFVCSVSNIEMSSGGTNIEDDENFRDRIHLAPEKFSVAGSRGAYKYFARSANSSIIDVAVMGPSEDKSIELGNVHIYPLMAGGELPDQTVLNQVAAKCNADEKRPLTDFVHVLSPLTRPFLLSVSYWIDRENATSADRIQSSVTAAVSDWLLWQRSALGRDLNPSELSHRMVAAGAKRVEIRDPVFTPLKGNEIAVLIGEPKIICEGLEDG